MLTSQYILIPKAALRRDAVTPSCSVRGQPEGKPVRLSAVAAGEGVAIGNASETVRAGKCPCLYDWKRAQRPEPWFRFFESFLDLVFSKKIRRRERQRWGGHAEFSRIVSRKVVEKIEKDRRKLWMICCCFHLCLFSWFECRDYLCRDRALEAVSAKNHIISPEEEWKRFILQNHLLEFLISFQMAL